MPRTLKADIGDRVHVKKMGRTEVTESVQKEENGKPVVDSTGAPVMEDRVVYTQDGRGQMVAKKKDIVLVELDGVVDGISVNQDDDGPYVDYSVKFPKTGKAGALEDHYVWARESEIEIL